MKAAVLVSHGTSDSVVLGDVAPPVRQPGQVLVRVKAGSLNRVDLYMRDSGAGITHKLPMIAGLDAAGVVEAVDEGEKQFRPGDAVVIYPGLSCGRCEFCLRGDPVLCTRCRIMGEQVDGVFADFVSVPAANVFAAPAGLSFEQAACLPTAYLTAWRMVVTQGRVRPQDDVLIFGVGGGVSLAALQICKMIGARAIVTSGSDEKLARAQALGADEIINHSHEDVVARVMAATGKRGVDVVIENVGQATWDKGMRSVVRGGRIVVCGATSGDAPSADLRRLFIRQIQVLGSTLGNPGEFADLLRTIQAGGQARGLVPVVGSLYPLEGISAAFAEMEAGAQFGKIGLSIG